jgi:hypothetical protein
MDTWGLKMLGKVRQAIPSVSALLMNRDCFEQYAADLAVRELIPVDGQRPDGLTEDEGAFLEYLLGQKRGRLEQEFLPKDIVGAALRAWYRA